MLMRTTGSFGLAALLTAVLYYAMSVLIQTSGVPVFTAPPIRITPNIHEPKEPPKPDRKPKPELVEAVPPPDIDFDPFVPTGPGDKVIHNPIGPIVDRVPDFDNLGYDRPAQPIFRQEPDFRNVTKTEFITLAFDVRPDGSVEKQTIIVIERSSSRMERPAIQAVKMWKYQPKVVRGEAFWQRNERVRFTVEPPK